ncbi:MAG: hypothetical protein DM484_29055, partial [Candidatus Methylumidiphilus alinenensis]
GWGYGGGHYGGNWGYGRGGYYGWGYPRGWYGGYYGYGIGLGVYGLGLGYGLGYYGWPYYSPYYGYGGYGGGYGYGAAAPAAPPVYIQQNNSQSSAQPQAGYWYYCRDPNGYYPYVKECPGGWQAVAPQPAQR